MDRAWLSALAICGMILCADVEAQQAAVQQDDATRHQSAQTKTSPDAQQAVQIPPKVEWREPTKEEVQLLLEGMKAYVNDSVEGLRAVEHADGSVSLDHQGRFQNVSLVRINPDGTISTECVSTVKEAEGFLKPTAAATSAIQTPRRAVSAGKASAPRNPGGASGLLPLGIPKSEPAPLPASKAPTGGVSSPARIAVSESSPAVQPQVQ
jgi:hypothetical protein